MYTVPLGLLDAVHGHGRMMEPPSRNAMWRFGYPNPVNYNENEVFCRGFIGAVVDLVWAAMQPHGDSDKICYIQYSIELFSVEG